jgi:hypothetical protein
MKGNPMSYSCDQEQWHRYTHLEKRAAAGQINRRAFLELASAIGIGTISAASADRAISNPRSRDQGDCTVERSYDYIVVGAGTGGCVARKLVLESAGGYPNGALSLLERCNVG